MKTKAVTGMPRAARSHQELGERHGTPSEPPEGTKLANTMISNF